MTATVKSLVQDSIRLVHSLIFDKGLPHKLGLCLHGLEPNQYMAFGQIVRFFRERSYRFVDPKQFVHANGGKAVFLSFDDNYRSWYEAADLFDRLDIRATFYVNPLPLRDRAAQETIDDYFERLNYDGTRVPLSSSELRTLHDHGHTIGAHTYSHRRLDRLDLSEAKSEIERSKAALEDTLMTSVRHFSYPYGIRRSFSPELQEFCREIGFETVANATGGLQHADHHPMDINRTVWHLNRPFAYNLQNLKIDGKYFERITGRSATG